jgi:hypothetical protein
MQQQTSEIVDYYAALEAQSIPGKAVFHRQISEDGYPTYLDAENDPCINSDLPDIPREDRMTAVMYVQPDGTALYAVSPKPPTPEAVARAQFVDKTYVWKGVAPKAQLP